MESKIKMEQNKTQNYQPTDYAGKLAKSFIRNPLTALILLVIIIVGYVSLEITPREENPQMVVSGSTIIIALPGATAKEVENVVVKPLERKMKEIKGVEHVYGMAMDSVAVINAVFFIGEKKEDSNLKIYDKIKQNMNMFPKGIVGPIIKPLDIDVDIPILSVAFYAKNKDLDERLIYDKVKEIQHRVNGIPNVAVTALKGGKRHQFNILVDLNKLSGYNISMGQIVKAVQALAYNAPNFKTKIKNGEIAITSIKNAIETAKDVGDIIIAQYRGSVIYLRDVAEIKDSYNIQEFKSANITYREENGEFSPIQPQVTLTISKLQGTNAVVIADEVLEYLEEHKGDFEKQGIGFTVTRNDGERANEAVNELVKHLVISIVIIAIVLFFVLGWKEALIVTITVPAIFSITLFLAYLTGQTVNRITLFAFLLSLGLLVDAAIIVIENIHRNLTLKDNKHVSMDEIMIKATDEIGPPTNIATFAIILTMVPMAFVGQMMGQFMAPIPANVPVALFASLVIAYIFTPYLATRLLKKHIHHSDSHSPDEETPVNFASEPSVEENQEIINELHHEANYLPHQNDLSQNENEFISQPTNESLNNESLNQVQPVENQNIGFANSSSENEFIPQPTNESLNQVQPVENQNVGFANSSSNNLNLTKNNDEV